MSNQETSKIHLLYEMKDSMSESLENLSKIINKQSLLTSVLKESNHVEEFKDLIEGTESAISEYNAQSVALSLQKLKLEKVLCEIEKSDENKAIIEDFMTAIGMFK